MAASKIVMSTELHGCGVYLINERLSCTITFTNQGAETETIAWVGAQIHCQACVREDIVQLQPPVQSPTSNETAFVPNRGEKGVTICSTPTTVLFCNLVLSPGEIKNVVYSEQLPAGGPPSFTGRLVKYSYKLAVGAQKLGCPAQISRIPFRVFVIPESLYLPYVTPSPHNPNPFLINEVKEDPTLELALQALATETSKRTSLNYTLKNQSGILGKVSLYKSSYKLSEDVTGSLDLTGATISCLQVSVTLQCIEEVSKDCLKSSVLSNTVPGLNSVCSVHAKHSECCHNTLLTQFSLPIPHSVSQSFQTSTVTVRWQLHFEFLIGQSSSHEQLITATPSIGFSGSSATAWKGVGPVPMDTMTWDLPISILPISPDQAEPLTQQKQHVIKL